MTTTDAEAPETWQSRLTERVSEILARNSMILAGFAAAFIIFTGFTLLTNPSAWALPVVGVTAALALFLTFVEARGFLKAIAATIETMVFSAFSFVISGYAATDSTSALLWFASFWVLFFGAIASSYMIVRGRSRWGALMLAEFSAFIVGYIVLYASLSVMIAAGATTVAGFLIYFVAYHLSSKSRYVSSKMPTNATIEPVSDAIIADADNNEWFARTYLNEKTQAAHYLTWKDRAYLLVPVAMNESFSIVGSRRSAGLGYMGRPINPWLVDLIYNKTPFWFASRAPVMVVLLDLKNANGKKPRVIAAQLPDTKRYAPVGVMPARDLLMGSQAKILEAIDSEFSTYTSVLNDRQRSTLVSIANKSEGSRYLSKVESDETDEVDGDDETDPKTSKTADTDR